MIKKKYISKFKIYIPDGMNGDETFVTDNKGAVFQLKNNLILSYIYMHTIYRIY